MKKSSHFEISPFLPLMSKTVIVTGNATIPKIYLYRYFVPWIIRVQKVRRIGLLEEKLLHGNHCVYRQQTHNIKWPQKLLLPYKDIYTTPNQLCLLTAFKMCSLQGCTKAGIYNTSVILHPKSKYVNIVPNKHQLNNLTF